MNQKYATFADGFGPWAYDYAPPPPITPPPFEQFQTTTVRDPLGKDTIVEMSSVQSIHLPDYLDYRTTRVTSVTNALGQETTYSYTPNWNLHRVTHPEGNWEQYGWTGEGVLISATRSPKPGSGLTATTVSATLTPGCPANPALCGRPATITDARGNVTSYTYDPTHGGLLTATSPAPTPGAVQPQTRTAYAEHHAWYKANGAATITQAAQPIWVPVGTSACTTSASCDGLAQEVQTSIIHQTGSASLGANILPISITSGSGDGLLAATITTVWDASGDPVTVDGPLAGSTDTTRYIYDAMRQPVGRIGPDPDGAGPRLHPATRTTYDGDGQPIFVENGTTTGQTDPAWAAFTSLQAVQTYYATKGLISRQVAFPGAEAQTITDYSYNGRRQPVCTAVRMNPAETAPLHACTLSTEGDYGPDRVTFNSYDDAARLIKVESAVGTPLQQATRTQVWTPNGRIDWVEDANGNRSDFTYDGLDRLAQLNFPMPTLGAHAANPADYEQYGYDANDNPLTKRTRAGETFTTAFDALNRITAIDAPSPTNDIDFTYDLLGRRLTASHPGGQTLTSTWDALGRNTAETGPLGAMTYQHDLAGRRTRMTWPDSVYVAYGWDLSNAMTEIRLNGAGLITAYAYDDLGRRTGITRGVGGAASAYAYDGGGRLLSLTQDPAGATHDQTYGFRWTPASQIEWRTSSNALYDYIPTLGATAYVNNGLNQNTAVGGAALAWSAQGNLTHDGAKTFAYDAANRLTGTTGSTLSYDPLDRLYQMTGPDAGRLQYDGAQLAAVYDGSGAMLERYVAGPSPDEWAVVYAGAGAASPAFPLQDAQGSVIALTDAAGAVTATLAYDPYGQPRPGNAGRMQYTGQMWLPDYGLYHYKARAYHPALGRFMQTDPVGYEEGMNLYAYVGNDPVNRTDPTGMYWDIIVELKGYKQGSIHGYGDFGHAYTQVTDTDTGESATFRGGPSSRYPSSTANVLMNRAVDGISLTTQVDPANVSPDTRPGGYSDQRGGSEVLASTNLGDDISFGEVVSGLEAVSGSLNEAQLPYQPRSVNSNWAAGVAYRAVTAERVEAGQVERTRKYPGIDLTD